MYPVVPRLSFPQLLLAALLCLGTLAGNSHAQGSAAPLYTEQDMRFLINMITHHQQAVDMAALVPARSDRAQFQRFARYVGRAQEAEIRLMESFLELAASRGLDVPGEPTGHDHRHMDGMLSPEQMEALAATEGAEFERLWLEGMIFHHEGAITMANAQQDHQQTTGRRPYGVAALLEDIIVEQRAEIHRMEEWLQAWGLRETAATQPTG